MAKGVPNFGGRAQSDCKSSFCHSYGPTFFAKQDQWDGRSHVDVANGQFGNAIRIGAWPRVYVGNDRAAA
jgi:hypothetical protein